MGRHAGREFAVRHDASVGKGADNTIVLAHRTVSTRHAHIYYDTSTESYYLEDLNSRNGIRLDGENVVRKERLGNLHVITFGRVDFLFQVIGDEAGVKRDNGVEVRMVDADDQNAGTLVGANPDSSATTQPACGTDKGSDVNFSKASANGTRMNERGSARSRISAGTKRDRHSPSAFRENRVIYSGFTLVCEMLNRTFVLKDGDNIIGRQRSNDITLRHKTVSKQHAIITTQGSRIEIRDLGSKNHTFLGDEKIASVVVVVPPMRIRFGAVEVVLSP
jgi:pSer/pThr/pTyr-binding forkhead associated (FHA) protein